MTTLTNLGLARKLLRQKDHNLWDETLTRNVLHLKGTRLDMVFTSPFNVSVTDHNETRKFGPVLSLYVWLVGFKSFNAAL